MNDTKILLFSQLIYGLWRQAGQRNNQFRRQILLDSSLSATIQSFEITYELSFAPTFVLSFKPTL